MEEVTLALICANLSVGEQIRVRTSVGRLLLGTFLSYEAGGVIGILVLSQEGSTLCLPSNQIERILVYDEDNTEDTLSPTILD
ncbi:MAG: hypothetical protein WAQ98_07130 [Blastocatellia bacterium]